MKKEEEIKGLMKVWETENAVRTPAQKELHLELVEHIASLFAAGKSYYYLFNFENMRMERVQENVTKIIGMLPEEHTLEALLGRIHPDDIVSMQKKESVAIKFLLGKLSLDQIPHYKVVYLIRMLDGNNKYRIILHQATALVVSDDGKIQRVLGVHTDVTYLNIPVDAKVSFISDKFPSYYADENVGEFIEIKGKSNESYTVREIEIIKLLAKGLTFKEIANQLFVSPHTVNTHKKNILRKANCRNTAELVSLCVHEGII